MSYYYDPSNLSGPSNSSAGGCANQNANFATWLRQVRQTEEELRKKDDEILRMLAERRKVEQQLASQRQTCPWNQFQAENSRKQMLNKKPPQRPVLEKEVIVISDDEEEMPPVVEAAEMAKAKVFYSPYPEPPAGPSSCSVNDEQHSLGSESQDDQTEKNKVERLSKELRSQLSKIKNTCRKCRVHGIFIIHPAAKGKWNIGCSYAECQCPDCIKVERSREGSKKRSKEARERYREEALRLKRYHFNGSSAQRNQEIPEAIQFMEVQRPIPEIEVAQTPTEIKKETTVGEIDLEINSALQQVIVKGEKPVITIDDESDEESLCCIDENWLDNPAEEKEMSLSEEKRPEDKINEEEIIVDIDWRVTTWAIIRSLKKYEEKPNLLGSSSAQIFFQDSEGNAAFMNANDFGLNKKLFDEEQLTSQPKKNCMKCRGHGLVQSHKKLGHGPPICPYKCCDCPHCNSVKRKRVQEVERWQRKREIKRKEMEIARSPLVSVKEEGQKSQTDRNQTPETFGKGMECRKCKHHGLISRVHIYEENGICPYRNCGCQACKLIERKRKAYRTCMAKKQKEPIILESAKIKREASSIQTFDKSTLIDCNHCDEFPENQMEIESDPDYLSAVEMASKKKKERRRAQKSPKNGGQKEEHCCKTNTKF